MTNEEIADAAGCESDADGMLAALRDTKWIDGEDGHYQLHDWSEHQRWVIFAPKRRESARKAAEIRWHKKQVKQKVNAPRMRPACEGDAESNAPSPSPDPNPSPIPKDLKPLAPTPGNGSGSKPNAWANLISWDKEKGCFEGIAPEMFEKWGKAYPAVDLNSQLNRADEWLKANPTKQKSNYYRFIVNWLSRAQERGGR